MQYVKTYGKDVIVLNYDYQVLGFIHWKKARKFVELGKCMICKTIKTAAGAVRPLVVRFMKMVRHYFGKRVGWKPRNVLIRDRFVCQYCGKHAATVDHVIPKSRGGGNTWDNTVAACKRCNNTKDNRMPREAGMHLARRPFAPTITEFTNLRIALLGIDDLLGEIFQAA